jgi:hypothetical protein
MDTDHISGNCTGDNTYLPFFKSIAEYEIDKNILGVTLENASNEETFIKALSGSPGIIFSGNNRFRCFVLGGIGFFIPARSDKKVGNILSVLPHKIGKVKEFM